MLNKLRVAVYSAVGGQEEPIAAGPRPPADERLPKFPYSRPSFLRLASEDEVQVAADRSIRPIMVPRDISCMPWMAGYAEAVNAGKSKRNEDTAHLHVGSLHRPDESGSDTGARSVPYYYFGLFDGHAGHGASTAAANQLHHIVHERLMDIVEHLLPPDGAPEPAARTDFFWVSSRELSVDKLVTGALEAAFNEMDEQIAEDRRRYDMRGGCTALVALFLLGRLYVANAGDSRAVVCRRGRAMVASHDFTPETERQRVRQLASRQPSLCGGEFTHLEFCRRLTRRDLGQRVLYRDAHMTGWAYKTVTESDIKFPVVCGEGKRSRVCATIGVTRGFGDHNLRAQNTNVYVKPFLLSQPEVLIINLEEEAAVTESDVLVMATDGLWDVVSNQRMAELVERALSHFPAHDQSMRRYRCISAAQELVMAARGKLRDNRQWRRSDGSPATVDDISVFVIPLLAYREEHLQWKAANAPSAPVLCPPLTNGLCPERATAAGEGSAPDRNGQPPAADGQPEYDPAAAAPPLDAGDGGPQELVRPAVPRPAHTVLGTVGGSDGRPTGDGPPPVSGGPAAPADGPVGTALCGSAVSTHPATVAETVPPRAVGTPSAGSVTQPVPYSPAAPVPTVSEVAVSSGPAATPVFPSPAAPVLPVIVVPTAPNTLVSSVPSSANVRDPPVTAVSASSTPAASASAAAVAESVLPAPAAPPASVLPSSPVVAPVVPALPDPVASPAVSVLPSSPAVPLVVPVLSDSMTSVAPSSSTDHTPPDPAASPDTIPAVPPLAAAAAVSSHGSVLVDASSPAVSDFPTALGSAPSSSVVHTSSSPVVNVPSSPVEAAPPSPVVPVPPSPVVPVPSVPGVTASPSPVVPALSVPAAPVTAPVPSSAPSPSSPSALPPGPEEPSAAPLIVGQTVPPTLVQTVPRSSVQLLPPAPAPAQEQEQSPSDPPG
ncbi:uncharacterized protein LOC122382641 [Amphibalanus amphitrite]|uniref:uncharacterized protein LOC122382641 n=1 Tax=Amphibalanus amphitrite TaxID=1232801 RepID=UPI001C8FC3B0|nr:uncharacterized protein LOC122382641 [Amphibalanus amphitrite]XP_043224178.1 uncharacterized protein LOC122382641 [Amphibalanus amphitrite]